MTEQPIGIIAAIPEELADLGGRLQQVTRHRLAGLDFHAGALDGRPVVLAEAGLGKVNAAMVATLLLQELGCRAVIFSGVAGGLDPALAIGDVVIGERLVAHDYGAIVAGELKVYQPGAMPLPGVPQTHGYSPPAELLAAARTALADLDLPELSAAATGGAPRRPRLRYGTILTGDVFVNCVATRERLFSAWQAQAVEMEGAAIAQVAERFGAPWLVVRALSDLAGADSHVSFAAFLGEAATIAALIVRRLAAVI